MGGRGVRLLCNLQLCTPAACRRRFPVNLIFVGMIGTSFWALQGLNVAMVTVRSWTGLAGLGGGCCALLAAPSARGLRSV